MDLREFFLENFAGDLEYHPRRAALYLLLGVAAGCVWMLSPTESKFTRMPLVFALGGVALLGKGIFLLRPSSEGFGVSDTEIARARRKRLPSIPEQAAQVLQDFGAGGVVVAVVGVWCRRRSGLEHAAAVVGFFGWRGAVRAWVAYPAAYTSRDVAALKAHTRALA